MSKVIWPFGPADTQTPASAATLAVTVSNNKTFLTPTAFAADVTVNLTIDPDLKEGAELIMKILSDGTARDVTPGTGMEGNVVTGTISKTNTIHYVFDGTNFVHQSTQLID